MRNSKRPARKALAPFPFPPARFRHSRRLLLSRSAARQQWNIREAMKKTHFFCITVLATALVCVFSAQYTAWGQQDAPKYVYLTFDDGPLAGSENIDRIVRAEQIKITVFVVGKAMETSKRLQEYFSLYEKNPYIEVYNHSFSHANNHYAQYYKNPQGVLDDIIKNETQLRLQQKIVRLPGANLWRVGTRKRGGGKKYGPTADLLAAKGYTLVGWDLEWEHNSKTGAPVQSVAAMAEQIATLFETKKLFTPGHLVLLLHDEMFRKNWEENELKQLIAALKQKGYILEHLRHYPGIDAQ